MADLIKVRIASFCNGSVWTHSLCRELWRQGSCRLVLVFTRCPYDIWWEDGNCWFWMRNFWFLRHLWSLPLLFCINSVLSLFIPEKHFGLEAIELLIWGYLRALKFEVAFGDDVLKRISLNTVAKSCYLNWTVFVKLFSLEKDIKIDLVCSLYHEKLIEHFFFSW